MKINPNWKSRKWIVALLAMAYGVVIHVFPSVAEHVAEEDLKTVATILLAWLGIEGANDVIGTLKNGGRKK